MSSQQQIHDLAEQQLQQKTAQIIPLHPPSRWHDPLRLIQVDAPSEHGRIVLWSISIFVLLLIVWAAFGKLDIIASAEGKLVPQTLVKIVQPAESGVIKALLVNEGDSVKAGQVLAKLDTTIAHAEQTGVASDLATQLMQVRRIEAELVDKPMLPKRDDDLQRFEQVRNQYNAHRKAFFDNLDQERSMLSKAEHERRSALETLTKLEQTLPSYNRSAEAYATLAKDGYVPGLMADDKQRQVIEKRKDIDAQRSTVAALNATIVAQQKKISQLQSSYQSDLEKELAEVRSRIEQLQPNLDKSNYKQGLMELKAPQDGVIKDLATTTVGAVVQPGSVLMTLVPQDEQLFADISIKNEDVGFVQVGQSARIKLAAYPFQKYGMLTGKVVRLSADATESTNKVSGISSKANDTNDTDGLSSTSVAAYKARVQLDHQILKDSQGTRLQITPGMQVVAEVNQGKQTVLEYLLSPVRKVVQEAGRER